MAAVGLAAYANSFAVPFTFDDRDNIVESPLLRDLGAFFPPWHFPGSMSRYVALLSFALDYRVHGLSPAGYHATNLCIHLASAGVLYLLALLSLRISRGGASAPEDGAGALLAGLLFVAHPVEVQAVTYVVQRMASLATLLYLGSLLCYAQARSRRWGPGAGALYAGSLALALLAMCTKETAFTLPVAIAGYDLAFFPGPARRRAAFLAAPLATLAVVPLQKLSASGAGQGVSAALEGATRVMATTSRWDYLLTQSTVVVRYLGLLLLPVGQRLEYDLPLRTSVLDPAVAASSLLLLALAGVGLALLSPRRSPPLRVAGFGIALFLLGLAVESTLVPIVDLAFEHRIYLPSAGLFLAVGAGFASLLERTGALARRRGALVGLAPAALAVVGLAAATHARNEVWRDPRRLWGDTVAKSPGSARAHFAYGVALWEAQDFPAAAREWEAALSLRPGNPLVLVNLGSYYQLSGDRVRAADYYRRALAVAPTQPVVHYKLAMLLEERGDAAGALEHYRLFARYAPLSMARVVADLRKRFGGALGP